MKHFLTLAIALFLTESTFAQNPEIVSVSPTSVQQGDTVNFTVIARNMHFTNSADAELIDPKTTYPLLPLSYQVLNDTVAIFKFFMNYHFQPDSLSICLKNSNDKVCKNRCINLQQGPLPPFYTITPNSANQGETVHITIKGTNTHFKPIAGNNAIVLFHTQKISFQSAPVNYINDSLLTVTFDFEYKDFKDAVGTYDFYLNESWPNPPFILRSGFTIYPGPNPPMLLSCSPGIVKQGDILTLRISARNTHFLSGQNSVLIFKPSLAGIQPKAIHVLNDSTLDADFVFNYNTIPDVYTLYVENQKDGSLSLSKPFTIESGSTPPILKSISPVLARKDQQINMRIIGEHSFFTKGPDVIYLRDHHGRTIPSDTIDAVNDTLMIARFTFSNSDSVGIYDCIVPLTTISPPMTLLNCFTLYSAGATILSISPSEAIIGDTIQLTVNAFHSHYLSGTTTVKLQSIYGGPPIWGSQLTVINDSTLSARFIFSDSLFNGKYNIIIKNDIDNYSHLNTCFTLNSLPVLPRIVDIYPKGFIYGSMGTITILASGTHFQQGVDILRLNQGLYKLSPVSMSIINDTVIKATFKMPSLSDLSYNNPFLDLSIEGKGSRLAFEHGVIVFYPTPVPEVENETEFYIYPNPSPGLFHLLLNDRSTVSELEVMDMTGRIILKQNNLGKTIDLDISSFPQGIYVLKLLSPMASKIIKLIKNS